MEIPASSTPVMCDMTDAPDTEEERIAEYHRLFVQALIGKDRTTEGIRFRFRAEPGIESWVRDLAARDKACCAFLAYEITADDDEVRLDWAVPDNDAAQAALEEIYAFPDTDVTSMDGFRQRFANQGMDLSTGTTGTVHHLRHSDDHAG
jgi:hypothetical protein